MEAAQLEGPRVRVREIQASKDLTQIHEQKDISSIFFPETKRDILSGALPAWAVAFEARFKKSSLLAR